MDPAEYQGTEEVKMMTPLQGYAWHAVKNFPLAEDSPFPGTRLAYCPSGVGPWRYEAV